MQIQHYFCSFLFIFERLPNLLYDFLQKLHLNFGNTVEIFEYIRVKHFINSIICTYVPIALKTCAFVLSEQVRKC